MYMVINATECNVSMSDIEIIAFGDTIEAVVDITLCDYVENRDGNNCQDDNDEECDAIRNAMANNGFWSDGDMTYKIIETNTIKMSHDI